MEIYKKIFFVTIIISFVTMAKAQQYTPMTAAGYQMKRIKADSALHIPSFCGIPTLRNSTAKDGAIAIDTCNNKLYKWTNQAGWTEIAASSVIDTTSLSNRINLKLNISDTANMLANYAKSSALALKLNISDTSNMLSPYLKKIDTANKWVNSITRTPGKDSIIYYIGGNRYAIKDSVGTGGGGSSQNGRFGNDTATVVMAKVHNDAGIQLTNGKVVRWSSSGTNSDAPSVRLANNKADSSSANTIGFVSGTINVNDTGWVILSGKIEKLNTSAFSNGDIIYLDSISGEWTKTKPTAPYHMVYLGVVVKANAGNGSIFVKCQNGYELDEIHDVKIVSPVNNQVLVYSDTQKLWKNRNVYSIVDTTSLSGRINQKVNIADTSSMLSNYAKSSAVALKVNISDTSTMLTNYGNKNYNTLSVVLNNGNTATDKLLQLTASTTQAGYMTTKTSSARGSLFNNRLSIEDLSGNSNYIYLDIDTATKDPYLMIHQNSSSKECRIYSDNFAFKNLSNGSIVQINAPNSSSNRTINFQDKSYTIADSADVVAKANLSQGRYSFLANNTNGTANMSSQPFYDAGSQTYSGSITWNTTGQPSGTTNHSYRWTQIGKLVILHIVLIYGTASTNPQTTVQIALPGDCPTPITPSGMTATNLDILYFGTGFYYPQINTIPIAASSVVLRGTSSGGYEIVCTRSTSTANVKFANITVQYFTNTTY